MALFLRRDIQRRVDEAGAFMSTKQLESIVARLNQKDESAIHTQWELIWLTALARVGSVQHEPMLPNSSRVLDVVFKNTSIEFIADIRTVSDAGYEMENPIADLWAELSRLFRKYQLFAGFRLTFDSSFVGEYRDRKVKLLLPAKNQVRDFVITNFEPFLREIVADKTQEKTREVRTAEGGVVRLQYLPKDDSIVYGPFHTFDIPYSLKRNPVYSALKDKKKQLAQSGFKGPKGVFLCDGDCAALIRHSRDSEVYTIDEIVCDFLRQNSSIDFVVTVGVREVNNSFKRAELRYDIRLCFGKLVEESTRREIHDVINQAASSLPNLQRTPHNAQHQVRFGLPEYRLGVYQMQLSPPMKPLEVKISSRTLAALLAGEIDMEKFREAQQYPFGAKKEHQRDIFASMVKRGRMLEDISLEKHPELDDDIVILRFGPTDAAAAKFRLPPQHKD